MKPIVLTVVPDGTDASIEERVMHSNWHCYIENLDD